MTDDEARDEVRRRLAEMTVAEAAAWASVLPERYRSACPADLGDDLLGESIARWAAEPTGNLILIGPTGSGKTHAAVAAARGRYAAGGARTLAFEPVAEWLDDLRPDSGAEYPMHRAMTAEVLILDDLAAERQTDWTRERLDVLVNHRWNRRLATIITSNATRKALERAVGDRVWSRLGDGALVVTVQGRDRRQA